MDLNVTNPTYGLASLPSGVLNSLNVTADFLDDNSSKNKDYSNSINTNVVSYNNFSSTINLSTNSSTPDVTPEDDLARKILLYIFFSICILIAVGGNLLVCAAVFTERRLKRIKNNYFIVSLAVADLLVACVVMTFAMANDIQQQWMFGQVFCRIWICFDIMCSTASILNLCVISFDRFKHIHNAMYYDMWMTSRKALTFIASVWVLSALISFLPIHLGWHMSGEMEANETINSDNECGIKLNFVYAIISSTISFYAPCIVMLILYFKLFLFARSHAITIRNMKRPVLGQRPGEGGTSNGESKKSISNGGSTRSSLRASDHKAAFTLGVITGVFLCCWLPFFVINPTAAYNPDLIHPNAFVVSTWLGYVNSCLNPIIYSIFNTEFREAFKKILSLKTCRRNDGYLPPSAKASTIRKKFNKSDYESQPADSVSITCIRKTSRDHLFNEKVTRL